jgi:GTP-binding protein EngB required for normal cell division
MDGDGMNAKAFAWAEDENEAAPIRAFDPAAVLRAIEDEDEADAVPPAARRTAEEADLGAALRAALDYEARQAPVADADMDEDRAETRPDWDEPADAEEEEDAHLAAEDAGAPWEDLPEAAAEDDAPHDEDAPAAPAVVARASFPPMEALDGPGRKPRVALMGEFSAGKSTLSNLLIGAAPLPMKVTATQLPPVWISWGEGQPYREDLAGETHPIDIARLSEIDPGETRMIRIFARSDVLARCDIIDMPGISDPNMESEVWERVIGKADAVIWCTHATQAWRQSEASVWETLDPALHARSLLLVTRFDKLHGESDRARVLRRVERETEGLFRARLPISLTEALSAGEDAELLEKCGAAAFRRELSALLDRLAPGLDAGRAARTAETLVREGGVGRMDDGRGARGITPSRILPRRIRPMSEPAHSRDTSGPHDPAL